MGGFLNGTTLEKAERLLLHTDLTGDRDSLEFLGLWNRGSFVSSLVTSEIFLRMSQFRIAPGDVSLDHAQNTPYAQQIICAGLRHMTDKDFLDVHETKVSAENAVGFRWGKNVTFVLQDVSVSVQVRTKHHEHLKSGPKPIINFFFNGNLNMNIELALNLNADQITEHHRRVEEHYSRYKKNGIVLHFQTDGENPVLDVKEAYHTLEAKNRVYTFVKKQNALYRGSRLVQSNVSRFLPSPPIRSLSTVSLRIARVLATVGTLVAPLYDLPIHYPF